MNNLPDQAQRTDSSLETGGIEPIYQVLRLVFGLLFLFAGIFIYYNVLSALSALLGGTADYPLLEKFTSSESRTVTLPGIGEKFALPPVFFSGMGYGLLVFIASVVVSIGNNLIRAGVSLIQPDARALIKRLRLELSKKIGQ